MRGIAVAALVGAFAACFSQPPAPGGVARDAPPGSGGGDGPGSTACPDGQTPVVFEAFDEVSATGSAACGSAGGQVSGTVSGGTLQRGGGVLTYTGADAGGGLATCTWSTLPQTHGVIVQWALYGAPSGADTTSVTASWTASTTRTTGLTLSLGPQLDFTSDGLNKSYTTIDLGYPWWRIAPASQTVMGTWFSRDGSAWSSAGTDPGTPPVTLGTLTIHFESADANVVKLDTIYLCP